LSIKNFIEIDVKYNMTPDLPKLRYFGGGVPVFLWDDLQDYNTLCTVLGSIDMRTHYESKFFNAFTVGKYVPWYNMDEAKERYAAYCLEEYEDIEYLSVPEYTIGKPLQVKGKVVCLSVEAIQELDIYYENEHIFTRHRIQVYPSQWSKQPQEVYAWLNDVDQISCFDSKTSEYILDQDIDPTPFKSKTISNGPDHYEM